MIKKIVKVQFGNTLKNIIRLSIFGKSAGLVLIKISSKIFLMIIGQGKVRISKKKCKRKEV
jgi:hypothetical protein